MFNDSDPPREKIVLETGKSLHVAKQWGIERIALDGTQNHLPGDCGGTKVSIEYCIGGRWMPREQGARLSAQGVNVDAIRFSDDGRGYDHRKLRIDYSDKPESGESQPQKYTKGAAGMHGEGLKLVSVACLRLGIPMQIRSRDWLAVPRVQSEEIDGKTVQELVYDVELGHSALPKGSRTDFFSPPMELVDYVNNIGRSALPFREHVPVIYSDSDGNQIIDGPGDIFVKGLLATSTYRERLMQDYNLQIEDLPRDRDHIKEDVFGNAIGKMIADCDDRQVITDFLSKAFGESRTIRSGFLDVEYVATHWTMHPSGSRYGQGRTPRHPHLWKDAFIELFGERTVLSTDFEHTRLARLADHDTCHAMGLTHFLQSCGIQTDKNVGNANDPFLLEDVPEGNMENVQLRVQETSIPLSYRSAKWGARRIVLDSTSNHLPSDVEGSSKMQIEFKIRPRFHGQHTWVPWKDYDPRDKAEAVRVVDDGEGYDYNYLSLFLSKKGGEEVGQFGEGLKLITTACVRRKREGKADDLKVKFQSTDWVAGPVINERTLRDGKTVSVLCFQILTDLPLIRGSMTTISSPDEEIVDFFRKVDDYVLPLRDDFVPLYSSSAGSLFIESDQRAASAGSVFNRGVYITDNYSDKLLFSYNIGTKNISPDRDDVDFATLQNSVHAVISSCKRPDVITRLLKKAAEEEAEGYLEFSDLPLPDNVAEAWKGVFYELYGDNAVLFTDPDATLEARHKGFQVIKLNENIAKTLHRAGVEYDVEVAYENLKAIYVPYEKLTPDERAMLERLRLVDDVLVLPHMDTDIIVYTKVFSSAGRDLTSKVAGFWDGNNIHMQRSQLQSFAGALRTYQHERGHKESEGPDPSDEFRHFFEYYMAAFVGKELEGQKADPSYRIGVEPFARWDIQRAMLLDNQVSELQSIVTKLKEQLAQKQGLEEEVSSLQSEVNTLKVQLQTFQQRQKDLEVLRPDDVVSFDLQIYSRISYFHIAKRVFVQTNDPELSPRQMIRILEYALLGKRRLTERLSGLLLGKPLPVEHKVDVFVCSLRTFEKYRWSDELPKSNELEKLDDRQKIRLLRKIARRERRPGSRDVYATIALDERKKQFAR